MKRLLARIKCLRGHSSLHYCTVMAMSEKQILWVAVCDRCGKHFIKVVGRATDSASEGDKP
jgi:hypothetical protein